MSLSEKDFLENWTLNSHEALERELSMDNSFTARKPITDWHKPYHFSEPLCGPAQWRRRDRSVVVDISSMDDRHLKSCLRFANKYPAHKSRLEALLHEWESRKASGALSPVPNRQKGRKEKAYSSLVKDEAEAALLGWAERISEI